MPRKRKGERILRIRNESVFVEMNLTQVFFKNLNLFFISEKIIKVQYDENIYIYM